MINSAYTIAMDSPILIISFVIITIAFLLKFFLQVKDKTKQVPGGDKYVYTKRQFIMTKAEREFYLTLQQAIGGAYMIYPQAHLDLFLDYMVKGQNWQAALSTIQRKSVDFLICSREYYNPLAAIELDDSSHTRQDRIERDRKLEEICTAAGMPLVRINVSSAYNSDDLLRQIAPHLT